MIVSKVGADKLQEKTLLYYLMWAEGSGPQTKCFDLFRAYPGIYRDEPTEEATGGAILACLEALEDALVTRGCFHKLMSANSKDVDQETRCYVLHLVFEQWLPAGRRGIAMHSFLALPCPTAPSFAPSPFLCSPIPSLPISLWK